MKMIKRTANKLIEKLRDRSGETIVETLVSMLIVVLAFMMLAGAIVASARVNASVEGHTLYLDEADPVTGNVQTVSGATVSVEIGGSPMATTRAVKKYSPADATGVLYFYE